MVGYEVINKLHLSLIQNFCECFQSVANEYIRKDQAILERIAKNDKKDSMRETATKHPKLMDQALLVHIAHHDKNWKVRREATRKLTYQLALANIAENDDREDVRKVAIDKLKDQDVLFKIAKNDQEDDIRRYAVARITDQSLLARIALSDRNKIVRSDAKKRQKILNEVKKLTEECDSGKLKSCEKLIKMAGKQDWFVREIFFDLVTDQTLLTEIANKGGSYQVCLAAVEKLIDKTILKRIAESDKNPNIRMAAKKRLETLQNQEQK